MQWIYAAKIQINSTAKQAPTQEPSTLWAILSLYLDLNDYSTCGHSTCARHRLVQGPTCVPNSILSPLQ